MKRALILIAFVVAGVSQVIAQQVPLYSHYYYNRFVYNPSLAGAEDYGQLYLIHRNQWNSIPGAPTTQAITLDGPLKSNKVGLGLGVYRDVAGIFNITGAQGAYRYSIQFNDDNRLNMGLSLGVLNNRLDLTNLDKKHDLDPVLLNAYQAATGFDANIGLSYQYKTLTVGFTVPQVIGNKLAYEALSNPITNANVQYGLIRHFILHANYDWDIQNNGKWFLQPGFMTRITPGAPFQYDVNVLLNYSKKFWGGVMYRSKYAVTIPVGMRVAEQLVVGYAYDIAVHKDLNQYTRGAHEVMLGFQFGGNDFDKKEYEKTINDINGKIDGTDKKVNDLEGKVKKNADDIKENTDDIEDNDKELDEIRDQLKTFQDFIDAYKSKNGTGVGTGDVFTFNNVYFETNKWDISTAAASELDNLVEILKDNPNLKIEVAGHADPRGSDSYNLWLSNKRSNAVRDYLIRKGVDPSQLEVKGYGEGEGAGSTLDRDRRVEFKIIAQ